MEFDFQTGLLSPDGSANSQPKSQKRGNLVDELKVGVVCSLIASIITSPFEVIRTRALTNPTASYSLFYKELPSLVKNEG